jgi:hypothetical protein
MHYRNADNPPVEESILEVSALSDTALDEGEVRL